MTAKMPSLFAKHPPQRPLTSLSAIVDDWTYRFGPQGISRSMRDEVADYCAEAKSYKQAIARACESLRPNGKMHNHQSRVPEKIREEFASRILAEPDAYDVKTFDEFYDCLNRIKPPGIGPVTLYDVATRIAAYKNIHLKHCRGKHAVESLYLHAGVRIGWCLLHGRRSPATLRLPRESLPKPLLEITTDEIEDLLCAYRTFLQPWCAK